MTSLHKQFEAHRRQQADVLQQTAFRLGSNPVLEQRRSQLFALAGQYADPGLRVLFWMSETAITPMLGLSRLFFPEDEYTQDCLERLVEQFNAKANVALLDDPGFIGFGLVEVTNLVVHTCAATIDGDVWHILQAADEVPIITLTTEHADDHPCDRLLRRIVGLVDGTLQAEAQDPVVQALRAIREAS